jgi:hypothetical protein
MHARIQHNCVPGGILIRVAARVSCPQNSSMTKSGQPDSRSITEKNHCVINLSNLRVVKVWNDTCLLTT